MTNSLLRRTLASIALFAAASAAQAQCVPFNVPSPGSPWPCCGVNFVFDGYGFQTAPFFFSGSGMTTGGSASPSTACSGPAGGGSLAINNVNVRVRIADWDPVGVRELSFRYTDFGGNINLTVNGLLRNELDFNLIGPGDFLPVGVEYFETSVFTGSAWDGTITLRAVPGACIHDVLIGGQELCIDDLCAGPGCSCVGDITGPGGVPDGNVDALDYLAMIAQWGSPCVGPCTADITGPSGAPDGNVDALDFLLLISQWGSPAC